MLPLKPGSILSHNPDTLRGPDLSYDALIVFRQRVFPMHFGKSHLIWLWRWFHQPRPPTRYERRYATSFRRARPSYG